MSTPPALLVSFLQRCLEDKLEGRVRSVADYQAMYPGHELAIAEEYERITRDDRNAVKDATGAAAAAAEPAEFIGHFRLIRKIGVGGQGVVYEAEDTRLGREVAVKVLSGRGLDSPDAWKRLNREALLISRLQHPGLCTVFEAGTKDGAGYIAMQRIDGVSLADRIAGDAGSTAALTRAEVQQRCRIVEQVCRAVHAAHAAGIVHRDLKPGNIMVTADDQPIVLDFGLARDLEQEEMLTRTGDVFGTPAYLAPERLQRDAGDAGPAADQYALAVTLFELLIGERPFRAATREGLYRSILEDPAPRMRSRQPAVPRDLDVVLATAMAKSPAHRYTSVAAFADDLAAVIESRPIAAAPPRAATRLLRWAQRDPARAALTAGLLAFLLAAAGLGGYLLAQRDVIDEGERAVEAQLLNDRIMTALNRFGQVGIQSEAEIKDALRAHPELRLPRAALAVVYLGLEKWQEAEELLLQRPEAQRDDPAFALLDQELQRRQTGGKPALPGADAGDCDDVTEFVLGSIYLHQLRQEKSQEWARRSVYHLTRATWKSAHAEIVYHDQLATALLLAQESERFVDVAEGMAHLWPDSGASWARLALARRMQNDVEGCREAFLRAAARDDRDPQNMMMLCLAEIELGLLDDSDRHFEQVIRLLNQLLPSAVSRQHVTRGRALLKFGQPERAVGVLAALVEREPDNEQAKQLLGEARDAVDALGRETERKD